MTGSKLAKVKLRTFVQGRIAAMGEPVSKDMSDLEKLVRDWVESYYHLHPPG